MFLDSRRGTKTSGACGTLAPQNTDEQSYGITPVNIDDFLEGTPVPKAVKETIWRFYTATRHRRALPVSFLQAE
ncbi:NAD synthetase [Paraburkholderia tropica]|nr:NAD synthetase [Paraburkholderia tropica]